jgi:hypothetical protein
MHIKLSHVTPLFGAAAVAAAIAVAPIAGRSRPPSSRAAAAVAPVAEPARSASPRATSRSMTLLRRQFCPYGGEAFLL